MKPDRVLAVPASFPTPLAAGFLIGYGTSYFALKRRGALQTGEWLLVSGAAGGVGLAAMDIAKRMGARVIAAEISAEKLAMARAYGADECIDCSTENLHEAVKRTTQGRGYDVYLDLVGGNLFPAALLIVGFAGGEIPQIPANYLLLKNLSAIGVGFGSANANDVQGLCRSVVADLAAMHARQPFSVEVGGEYRLENVADGLKRLSSRNAIGKLLIRPYGSSSMPKAVAAAIAEATVPETTIQFRQAITEALAEEEELERDPTVFVAGEDVGIHGGVFGLTSRLYERLALLDKIHHGQQKLPLLGQEAA